MELVRELGPARADSPLAGLRLRRRLTLDEAARRADLPPEQARWLEDGRLYRFGSSDDALVAVLLYASALRIEPGEARELAGLETATWRTRWRRAVGAVAIAAALVALALSIILPGRTGAEGASEPSNPGLPPAWEISVDVLNGGGDINWTRQVASRVGALAYQIEHVGRADRFDYTETAVFYERGGKANAARLAQQLGVGAKPLPGGKNPRRLVVVVGPRRGPGL